MKSDDAFESWKRHRARADVPPGFAARVAARLTPRRRSPGAWLRLAACVVAGAACLLRMACVLGLFLPS